MPSLGMVAVFHDATVVLCERGRVLYGIEEERLSRLKYELVFPHRALSHVLDANGLKLSDIDSIGFFWNPRIDLRWMVSLMSATSCACRSTRSS